MRSIILLCLLGVVVANDCTAENRPTFCATECGCPEKVVKCPASCDEPVECSTDASVSCCAAGTRTADDCARFCGSADFVEGECSEQCDVPIQCKAIPKITSETPGSFKAVPTDSVIAALVLFFGFGLIVVAFIWKYTRIYKGGQKINTVPLPDPVEMDEQ